MVVVVGGGVTHERARLSPGAFVPLTLVPCLVLFQTRTHPRSPILVCLRAWFCNNRGDYIEVSRARAPPVSSIEESDDPDAHLLYSDTAGDDPDELIRPRESTWPATSATIVANSACVQNGR